MCAMLLLLNTENIQWKLGCCVCISCCVLRNCFQRSKGSLMSCAFFLLTKASNNSSVTNLSIGQKGWLHSARRSENKKCALWNTQKSNEKSYEMKSSVESLQLKTSISSICKCDTLEYLTLRTDENPNSSTSRTASVESVGPHLHICFLAIAKITE